jgi:hypothetical protein
MRSAIRYQILKFNETGKQHAYLSIPALGDGHASVQRVVKISKLIQVETGSKR